MDRYVNDSMMKIFSEYREKFGETPYTYWNPSAMDWDKAARAAQRAIETNMALTQDERESFEKEYLPGVIY